MAGVSLAELARRTSRAPSELRALLREEEEAGRVARDEAGRYSIRRESFEPDVLAAIRSFSLDGDASRPARPRRNRLGGGSRLVAALAEQWGGQEKRNVRAEDSGRPVVRRRR